MNFHALAFCQNRLLSAIPPSELALLRPHLKRVPWVNGQGLYEAGERIGQVFFVEQGFALMVDDAEGASGGTKLGLIGREGMVGLPVLLSPQAASFHRTVVQLPGFAFRMQAQVLRDSLGLLPELRRLLFQALEGAMAQLAQTAVCNSRHLLSQRLARWLLMAHDRVDGDELAITQESLSAMLAVRRSGVTVAVQALRAAGVVSHQRSRVTILDRAGLEAAACGCYGRVRAFTDGHIIVQKRFVPHGASTAVPPPC